MDDVLDECSSIKRHWILTNVSMYGDYRIVCPGDILLTLFQRERLLKLKVMRALDDASLHHDKTNLRATGCGSAVLDWPEGVDDWRHRTGIGRGHSMASGDDYARTREVMGNDHVGRVEHGFVKLGYDLREGR